MKTKNVGCYVLVVVSIWPFLVIGSGLEELTEIRSKLGPFLSSQLFTDDGKLKETYQQLLNGNNLSDIINLISKSGDSSQIADVFQGIAKAQSEKSEVIKDNGLQELPEGSETSPGGLGLQYSLGGLNRSVLLEYLYSGALVDGFIPKDESDPERPPLVATAEGVVRGFRVNRNGVRYSSFLGIPYASPPVRFQTAKPPTPWTGIRDATKDGSACMQKLPLTGAIHGSEDCLYLNIHTPSADSVGLPVLVLIHGGSFKQLTGNSYIFGPGELMKEDTIHVSFNYRLGPLGFLSTKTAGAPGNAGMKDIVEALKWVQRNVHMFGGNPQKVTLYGVSTGGAAVEYMTLSKMSSGLFSQTISQSSSAVSYWAYAHDPLKYAFMLGKYLGLKKTDVNELLQLLRDADAGALIEAAEKLGDRESPTAFFLPFVPCAEAEIPGEERFLHDHPERILISGDYIKVPSMVGFNDLDGSEFIKGIEDNPEYLNNIDELFEYLMPADLMDRLKYPRDREVAINKVRQFYLNGERISNSTAKQYAQMMGDSKLFYGIAKSVFFRLRNSQCPIYFWQFAYDSEFSIFRKFYHTGVDGAAHGDDLGYVFTTPFFIGVQKSEKTKEVSQRLSSMIANFMKWGNPTPFKTTLLPVTWKPIQSVETMDYMKLSDKIELLQNPYQQRLIFWKNLYASVN